MKIALVQLNPVIGDFAGNCARILNYAEKACAAGCDLVVFPELAISGAPPQDLVERPSFLDNHEKAYAEMVAQLPDIDVLFGGLERSGEKTATVLYNTAFVARQQKIVFKARKQLLNNSDVAEESRHFTAGSASRPYVVGDSRFGIVVGDPVSWDDECAMSSLFESDIDGLLVIAASPFHWGKEKARNQLFAKSCASLQCPLLFCNQVGGQDGLLFDGRSLAMAASGEVFALAQGYVEDMIIVDCATGKGDIHASRQLIKEEAVYGALVMGVCDYVTKCGFSSVVLGLSGGIDSALTAAIAADALGPDNVLGVAMPSPYSSEASVEDAEQLAINLGCRFEKISLEPLFTQFTTTLEPLFAGYEEDLTEQNIQARIRGDLLMALSNKFGCMLLSTGNKSELAVGYCTLYGDMCGGLGVIADVPKQLVYALSHYVNRQREIIPQRTIDKPPSAELRPDQCDQDELPPYDLLDEILELYLEQGLGKQELVARGYEMSIVADVLRRIHINEYKRKQAALALKVTTKAFGPGRRYPVAHYRG